MKRKYLDEIGYTNRPDTYCKHDKERMAKWKLQRKELGFDGREIWNLDVSFYCWLYERLRFYLETAPIDLSYNKFEFEGNIYTQKEMIENIISTLEKYLLKAPPNSISYEEETNNLQRAAHMWAEVLPAMWI